MAPMIPVALLARLTDTQPVLRTICAWCPTFDKTDPANKGASHTICPSCAAKLQAEMDATDTKEAA
jgi:hypothetical protein